MATPISGDIWHLSIDDLLAPIPASPRLGGPGPFVINLSASTAPISQPRKEAIGCDGAYVYQVQRTEDRRVRHRLRLGPFVTEDDAESVLAKVRDLYPSALTATAEPDDLRMISSLRAKSTVAAAAAVSTRAPVMKPPAAPSTPAPVAQPPIAPSTPALVVQASAVPPTPAPAVRALAMPSTPSPVVQAPVVRLAEPVPPVAKVPVLPVGLAPPAQASIATARQPVAAAVPAATATAPANDISQIPVLTQIASVEPRAAGAPKVIPASAPDVSAVPTLTEAGVVWPPLTKGPVSAEPPWVTSNTKASAPPVAATPAVALLTPAASSQKASPPPPKVPARPAPVLAKTPPTLKTMVAPAKPAAAAAPATSVAVKAPPTTATRVLRTPTKAPHPAPIPSRIEKLNTPLPNLESTQTLRPLTALELEDTSGSQWFVIQLSASEVYFDPDSLPNLDIFSMYRLYAVTGIDQGKVLHALRLGFFSEEIAAKAVASYLAGFYEKPAIKRVSNAERERFANQRVEARKDIGATGKHAAIEITADRIARKAKSETAR